jgi:hypothetical protein
MAGITYQYSGDDQRLADAIGHAAALLRSSNFRAVIEARESNFFNTTRTCRDIARAVFECDVTVTLSLFSRKPRFGRLTTAYVDPDIADIIFFNTYAIGRGDRANTNTLVHETIHVIDKFHDTISGFDFTHDGNDPNHPPQNRDSAPYWIGNRAEDLMQLVPGVNKGLPGMAYADAVGAEQAKALVTDINWAGDAGFCCGTHKKMRRN